MSKLETNTIDTVSGTTNLTIGSTNTSTITMPNGALSGQNYPAFEAYLSADQTPISDNVTTKAEIDTEVFDTDNCYDNSTNYRFTPTVAGKYYVYASLHGAGTAGNGSVNQIRVYLYKNGSVYRRSSTNFMTANIANSSTKVSAIIEFNGSSDYVEAYAQINVNSSTAYLLATPSQMTNFGAYRIGA